MAKNSSRLYTFDGEPVRLMFPELAKAKAFKEGGKKKFSTQFLIPKTSDHVRNIAALLNEILVEAFPGKKLAKMPYFDDEIEDEELRFSQNPGIKHPLQSGNRIIARADSRGRSIENLEHLLDAFVLTASTGEDIPPRLFANGLEKPFSEEAREATAKSVFYPGLEVWAQVSLSSYKEPTIGITSYLQAVFSSGKGERMGGNGGLEEMPKAYSAQKALAQKLGYDEDDFTGSVPAKSAGRKVPEMLDDEIPF